MEILLSLVGVIGDLDECSKELDGIVPDGSSRSTNILQYADDTCLIADGPSSCQQLLNCVERWLQWSGMKAKVLKCHSLAIQASSGKTYDPSLMLQGECIPSIGNNAIKFLGGFIQVPLWKQADPLACPQITVKLH